MLCVIRTHSASLIISFSPPLFLSQVIILEYFSNHNPPIPTNHLSTHITMAFNDMYTNFDDMPIEENLLRGTYAYGFEKPSDVQQRIIGPIIKGNDLNIRSYGGSGKTAAYCVGLLGRVDMDVDAIQGLIMCPTRELATSIHCMLSHLGEYISTDENNYCLFVGGTAVRDSISKLESGKCVIAVGTPGRLLDLANRGLMRLDGLKTVIYDEADDIMDKGFEDQIHELNNITPDSAQVVILSPTAQGANALANKIMRCPEEIIVKGRK